MNSLLWCYARSWMVASRETMSEVSVSTDKSTGAIQFETLYLFLSSSFSYFFPCLSLSLTVLIVFHLPQHSHFSTLASVLLGISLSLSFSPWWSWLCIFVFSPWPCRVYWTRFGSAFQPITTSLPPPQTCHVFSEMLSAARILFFYILIQHA